MTTLYDLYPSMTDIYFYRTFVETTNEGNKSEEKCIIFHVSCVHDWWNKDYSTGILMLYNDNLIWFNISYTFSVNKGMNIC